MSASRNHCLAAVCSLAVVATLLSACSPTNKETATDRSVPSDPEAVVERTTWDVGEIESGVQFGHTFEVRNAGGAPLELSVGKGLCKCMYTELPDAPIPPGGRGKIKLTAADSVKNEPMNPGPFSRKMHLLTNDPRNSDIVLGLVATVVPRMAVSPSPVMLVVDTSKPDSRRQQRR